MRGGFAFIFLTIALTVAGQLLVKWGMTQVGRAPNDIGQMPAFILRALFHPGSFFGLVFAFLAAFSWMAALSRCDLSFAYPFMSLAIVLVLTLTPWVFGEDVSARQWVGVSIVCVGLWIASRPA
jgi:multidrug transporter EmrE-like cation transporter